MDVTPLVWWITILVTSAILIFDILDIGAVRTSPRAARWSRWFYVGLAMVFGLGVWYFAGAEYGGEFFAGWLTEYSLSIDNLFIFIVIMGKFAVPAGAPAERPDDRHRARAHHAWHLHRGRRRRDRPVQLGLLHLRRVPDVDCGQPRPRGREEEGGYDEPGWSAARAGTCRSARSGTASSSPSSENGTRLLHADVHGRPDPRA